MIKALAAAAMILMFAASSAFAQGHRPGDAALGALSGAVVFGPVGAVAGAVVGYAAGPSIARSWGFDRPGSSRHRRHTSKERVRSARAEAVDTQAGRNPQATASRSEAIRPAPAPGAKPSAPLAASTPPVQTLE
jgi:hypothetical protein